jgi:hypothetical protein
LGNFTVIIAPQRGIKHTIANLEHDHLSTMPFF